MKYLWPNYVLAAFHLLWQKCNKSTQRKNNWGVIVFDHMLQWSVWSINLAYHPWFSYCKILLKFSCMYCHVHKTRVHNYKIDAIPTTKTAAISIPTMQCHGVKCNDTLANNNTMPLELSAHLCLLTDNSEFILLLMIALILQRPWLFSANFQYHLFNRLC